MIQQSLDFIEHHANILCSQRHFDAEQLFDRHHVSVLVAHHRYVIETIHVWHRLQISLLLGQFLGCPVQQAYMRVCALDDFTIELEHQSQNTMCRRMLRSEIQGVILDLSQCSSRTFPHGSPAARSRAARPSRADSSPASALSRSAYRRSRCPENPCGTDSR